MKTSQKNRGSLDNLRKAAAQAYAQAALSFGDSSTASAAERRAIYEQGWLDCIRVMMGVQVKDPARTDQLN